jgi:hypothetical protein
VRLTTWPEVQSQYDAVGRIHTHRLYDGDPFDPDGRSFRYAQYAVTDRQVQSSLVVTRADVTYRLLGDLWPGVTFKLPEHGPYMTVDEARALLEAQRGEQRHRRQVEHAMERQRTRRIVDSLLLSSERGR